MVCAQTEQPKDSIKGHRETVPEIRQGLHINDRNIQTDGTLPDNTRQAAAGKYSVRLDRPSIGELFQPLHLGLRPLLQFQPFSQQ